MAYVVQGYSMLVPWMKLTADATMLTLEAQAVIWTRLSLIAMGRGTPAENLLMVTEKLSAFTEACAVAATGGSAHKIVRGYRKKVRANITRLRR